MEISSITGINHASFLAESMSPASSKTDVTFDSFLANEINNVNANINKAEANINDFATGKSSNIHEMLLSIEEAKLSFQMILQVRNKVLESMQEVLRMQV